MYLEVEVDRRSGSVNFLLVSAADEKNFLFGTSRTILETQCIVRIVPLNNIIAMDGIPIMACSNVLSAPDVAKSLPRRLTRISHDIGTRSELLA